jgi:hypothetical protein
MGIAAVGVAAVAAVNANYALQDRNLSALVLANVEALTQEADNGVREIVATDCGREDRTINGVGYSCRKNRVDCNGTGSYSCQPGHFYDDCKRIITA